MKLYADDSDLNQWYGDDAIEAVEKILPRRCSDCDSTGHFLANSEWSGTKEERLRCTGYLCSACEGRGWLYPDEPDWGDDGPAFGECLEYVWKAMGIYDF